MKKFTLFLLLLTFVFVSCKNKIEYSSAEDYNNAIVSLQEKLYSSIDSFENYMNADEINVDKINSEYENTKKVSKSVIKDLENMTPFEDDKDFYNSTKNLFTTFDNLLGDEYASLVKFLNKPIDGWSDSDFGVYYDTWDKLEDKIIKSENEYFEAQENFATQNKLDLQ